MPTQKSNTLRSLNPAMPLGLTIFLGVLMFTQQPLGTDLYLPSMPALGTQFNASVAQVARTMTAFLVAFGLAQIISGPLCDRFGRRTLALWGTAIFTLGSAGCALSPSLDVLVLMRAVQAVGACASFVAARAAVRDNFAPQDGARVISTISSFMVAAPVGGILLGGAMVTQLGWRFSFGFLAVYGCAVFAVLWLKLPETLKPADLQRINVRGLWASYGIIVRNASFRAYTLTACAGGAGLFCHLSASSMVYIRVLGETAWWYSICFAVGCFGYLSGTVLIRRWLPRIGATRLLMRAGIVQILSMGFSIALASVGVLHWAVVAGCNFFFLIGYGLLMSTCQAGSVAPFPDRAGTAGSLMGAMQIGAAALAGWWMGVSFNGTVFPMIVTQLCCGLAVLVCAATLVRKHGTL
jgi:MFS transporter, DHA1 family, multidrug resistance protein